MTLPYQAKVDRRLVSEAFTFLDSILHSPAWMLPTEKGVFRSHEEVLAGKLSSWAKAASRTFRRLGYKPYYKVTYNYDGGAASAVFAKSGREYRIVYAEIGDLAPLEGKKMLPMTLTLHYGRLRKKYVRLYDIILPRIKRHIASHGIVYSLSRSTKPSEATGVHLEAVNTGVEELEYQSGKLVEKIRLYHRLVCAEADLVFLQYKARYLIIIPPIIIWKWGHYLTVASTYNTREAPYACPTRGVGGLEA